MKRLLWAVVIIGMAVVFSGCQQEIEKGTVGRPSEKETTKIHVTPKGPDISRGLVGWWKFDEVMGMTARDSSGRGRNGALKGSLSFDNGSVEGRIGKALNIGGADYVEVTGYKGILGTEPRTVTVWLKTKSRDGKILSWGQDEGAKMFIFGFIRGRPGITPKGGYYYMKYGVSDDKWHHVAAVVHEAELPNLHDHVTLYSDGEVALIDDIGLLDLYPIDTPSGMDVAIGKGFEGTIDDVRIYDRALSYDEIRLLFTGK